MILASKSPRRKEILENIGFNLEIKSKNIEEISDEEDVIEKIKDIAYKKTEEVAKENLKAFVVGADTIVEVDGEILGKPKNEEEAYKFLTKLSGRSHNVITAYSLINKEKNISIKEYSSTKVYFRKLDDEMIKWYIQSKEPMDKAGAYGIQEKGSVFVEKIEGDFFTVMGFPIEKFIKSLEKIGISLKDIGKI
ncbi:Maf family protein [uncultured Fusobacterium sp.]|uniref:nucleoside triphosphate pyrophosphatase n=1 Tax=uncultured Fusobacterium sp. TaxID=159267 RepID=UPI0025FFDDBD|nr:Maf family protein [uncultured Fusobacterium sp.]